jgi:hypothetical protein
MKNYFLTVCCLAGLALASSSCKKAYDDNSLSPLAQAYAPIPVMVTNANFFERYYIVVAKAPTATEQGNFTINFSIPADKGKIKEITRVAVGGSGLNTVQTGAATLLYNYNGQAGSSSGFTPIPGNGSNTITFSSTLTDYKTFQTRVGTGVAPTSATVSANLQSPNQIDFYFLLTLEDGTTLIPPRVQVRVVQ